VEKALEGEGKTRERIGPAPDCNSVPAGSNRTPPGTKDGINGLAAAYISSIRVAAECNRQGMCW